MLLEVCANSVQSAINADIAGAQRIELCQNLNEGGTTPSWGAIQYCIRHLSLQTFVLIRPRTGDFCYTDAEFEVIKNDVLECKKLGVAGVVVGFLNPDYTIDKEKTAEIVKIAAPMEVTFHRAFDICARHEQSLEDIIACGCHRILTSGFKKTAEEGVEELAKLKQLANGRIAILVGSGINQHNIVDIATKTGLTEFHASCKSVIKDNAYNSEREYLDNSNIQHSQTNSDEVRKILQLLKK